MIIVLEKLKIPRTIGAVVVMLVLVAAVYVFVLGLFESVKTIVSLYPKYEERSAYLY